MASAERNNPSAPRHTPSAPPNPHHHIDDNDQHHPHQDNDHFTTHTDSERDMWSPAYRDLMALQDQARCMVQKGLTADEQRDAATARQCYLHSLSLIDHVLSVNCRGWPQASQAEIEDREELQRKMGKTKLQVLYRMDCIGKGGSSGEDSSSFSSPVLAQDGSSSVGDGCCSGERGSALANAGTGGGGGGVMEACASFSSGAGSELVKLPSYEEAISTPPPPSSPHTPTVITEAGIAMAVTPGDPRTVDPPLGAAEHWMSADGTEVFRIADGVQIFHISCQGFVTAPSYPTSLRIVTFEHEAADCEGDAERGGAEGRGDDCPPPQAFLQVGDWLYPLIPEASPILHTAFGAYVFPDLSADRSGSSVGLILPDSMTEEDRHTLEDVLRNLSNVKNQERVEIPHNGTEPGADNNAMPPPPSYSPSLPESHSSVAASSETVKEKDGKKKSVKERKGCEEEEEEEEEGSEPSTSELISRGIIAASSFISWGLEKGAEKAGQWIAYGSEKLRHNMRPDTSPTPVHPHMKKGAMYARKASNCAVTVSSYIVTKLGEATVALGRTVAPHLRRKGEELLPRSLKTEKNRSRLDGVVEVAATGLHGISTVWLSLEAAAKALGKSVATETVATVQHKFGQDAGKLAEDTVYTAGNMAMTTYVARSLAMKAIATRTARDAGSAVVYDLRGEEVHMGDIGAEGGEEGRGEKGEKMKEKMVVEEKEMIEEKEVEEKDCGGEDGDLEGADGEEKEKKKVVEEGVEEKETEEKEKLPL